MEQDNSWYENDEIPPVGTKCIADFSKSRNEFLKSIGMVNVEIVMHSMCADNTHKTAVFRWKKGNVFYYHAVLGDGGSFRPKKSDRENAIEKMSKIIHEATGGIINDISLGALYDAGLLKSGE